jgi:CheY-like chemotaxis protein
MGLSVVRGIMSTGDRHVIIDSTAGTGTTLRLLFPPATGTVDKQDVSNQQKLEPKAGVGQQILVVDDEGSLADFMGDLLEHYHYEPTVCTDPYEAVSLFNEQPDKYELLITDQTMPAITGLQLIDIIRDTSPNLPVILCSGYSLDNNETLIKEQVDDFIKKPFKAKIVPCYRKADHENCSSEK